MQKTELFHWFSSSAREDGTFLPPFLISHCGHSAEENPSYCWPGEKRDPSAIWQYTLAGEGELQLPDGSILPQRPGDAMILTTPEAHCYRLPERSPRWEFLYLGFRGAETIQLLGEFRKRYGSCLVLADGGETVSCARDVLSFCRDYRPVQKWKLAARCYRFLTSLFQTAARRDVTQKIPAELEAVRDYCTAHPGENLTLERLAGMAGTSLWHFARRFKSFFGMTPGEYVCRVRMEYAGQLLRTTRLSVKEVAQLCGFEDSGYFVKVFRRNVGCAPGSFRQQSLK